MDAKEKFNLLCTLRAFAWTSFDQRRRIEWEIMLAVWTPMSALIGFLAAKGAALTLDRWTAATGTLLVVFLSGLTIYYISGLHKAQYYDRNLVELYDQRIDKEFLEREFSDADW